MRRRTTRRSVKVSGRVGGNVLKKSARAACSHETLPATGTNAAAGGSKVSVKELEKFNGSRTVLFQAGPDPVVIVDATGCIVRANDRAESMSGYSREELLGKRIEVLIPARLERWKKWAYELWSIVPR